MRKNKGGRNPISHVILSVPSPISWAFSIKIIYFLAMPTPSSMLLMYLITKLCSPAIQTKFHHPVSMHSVSHLPTIWELFDTRELHYHNNVIQSSEVSLHSAALVSKILRVAMHILVQQRPLPSLVGRDHRHHFTEQIHMQATLHSIQELHDHMS